MGKIFSKNVVRLLAVLLSAVLVLSIGWLVSANVFAKADEAEGEDGYDLWLRYRYIEDNEYRSAAENAFGYLVVPESGSEEVIASAEAELKRGLEGLFSQNIPSQDSITDSGALVVGTKDSAIVKEVLGESAVNALDEEGYLIESASYSGNDVTVIAGGGVNGVLYGAFELLEMLQCREPITDISVADAPKIEWRVLDQWDNWSGSIERGYAGRSIYNWSELPDTVDPRYEDFARANASIGINTIVINNVNTQIDYIKTENLPKVAKIADVFRKWGIRLALAVRFDSPEKLGGLSTSDPFDTGVVEWWEAKFDEIYALIPDFAGVLVKADSEGQSGPSEYGRTHADGANMFSDILAAHNDAVVMWRAFVYGKVANQLSSDIANQAYRFFKPLDGEFNDNVVVQSKNGPRDFLPIEPVAPLFGGMTDTNMGLELQITQEYTGQSTHLCYLIPMWKYYLETDMMVTEDNPNTSEGTTLKSIVEGTVYDQTTSLIAGVANIGDDTNWTRLELAQANWYGFGKLAWDPDIEEEEITDSWIKMTFGHDEEVIDTLGSIMRTSWETYMAYTDPYGLGMTVDSGTHFSAALDYRNGNDSIRVDEEGMGHNRTSTGTGLNPDATELYSDALGAIYADINTCPEELLFWFHHVPYDFVMSNGKTMLENVYQGLKDAKNQVMNYKIMFDSLEGKIDSARFERISQSFVSQLGEVAKWYNEMTSFIADYAGAAADHVSLNLAEGKTAYASQTRKDFTADLVTDGEKYTDSSRWATEQRDENHYIFIDLGKVQTVNRVELYWENFSMRYVIEVATELTKSDGSEESDWTVVAEGRGNEWSSSMYGRNDTSVLFADTQARYVRMRTLEKSSSLWNSLYEFEVYGDDFVQTAHTMLENEIFKAASFTMYDCSASDLQLLKNRIEFAQTLLDKDCADEDLLLTAYTKLKSAFNEMNFEDLARNTKARRTTVNGSNHAGGAVDGSDSTYWRPLNSDSAPSMTIDLGEKKSFDLFEFDWKSAPQKYTIEAGDSENGSWTLLKEVDRTGLEGTQDAVQLDSTRSYRFIRLSITERAAAETSLYRFSVYDTKPAAADAKNSLQTSYDAYSSVAAGQYTQKSFAELTDALTAAEAVLSDTNASLFDIEDALHYLEGAFADLYEKGNSSELSARYEEWKDVAEGNAAFDQALSDVQAVLADSEAMQFEIDNALKNLDSAYLNVKYFALKDLSLANYTQNSADALRAALEQAKSALEDAGASRESIEAAIEALEKAESELTAVTADKSALQSRYDELKDTNLDDYTDESAAALREALQAAEEILANASATQSEVDACLTQLNDSFANLESVGGGCQGSVSVSAGVLGSVLLGAAAVLVFKKSKRRI